MGAIWEQMTLGLRELVSGQKLNVAVALSTLKRAEFGEQRWNHGSGSPLHPTKHDNPLRFFRTAVSRMKVRHFWHHYSIYLHFPET